MGRTTLILVNSFVRLAWGIGALASPEVMAPRLVPDTEDRPDARLFVRGFAAHQVGVAAVGLMSIQRNRLQQPAMVLAVGIDALDVLSAVVESLRRHRGDVDTIGGMVFSAAGAATAATALAMRN